MNLVLRNTDFALPVPGHALSVWGEASLESDDDYSFSVAILDFSSCKIEKWVPTT